jgi:ribosomal protein S17
VITEFDCFKFTKKGKRIDKTESCMVAIDGDVVTIEDSGGVGDNITWTVVVSDGSGNTTAQTCVVTVENPGKGK